jgi:hypothetical protein
MVYIPRIVVKHLFKHETHRSQSSTRYFEKTKSRDAHGIGLDELDNLIPLPLLHAIVVLLPVGGSLKAPLVSTSSLEGPPAILDLHYHGVNLDAVKVQGKRIYV